MNQFFRFCTCNRACLKFTTLIQMVNFDQSQSSKPSQSELPSETIRWIFNISVSASHHYYLLLATGPPSPNVTEMCCPRPSLPPPSVLFQSSARCFPAASAGGAAAMERSQQLATERWMYTVRSLQCLLKLSSVHSWHFCAKFIIFG